MTYLKLFFVGILVGSQTFFSQKINVSGQSITHENSAAVPYASVILNNLTDPLKSDAILTDEKGNFNIDLFPGHYQIEVNAVDFLKFNKKISISKASKLEAFVLVKEIQSTNTKEIKEVVITVQTKVPFKIDLDKKVYNVDSDLTTKGGTLSDVLANLPSVNIDPSGSVSMRGNSNVRFLINGKPSSLMGITDDANVLSSIPASSIDRIEIITNPSSKYDAAGTAGILNIILKKNSGVGFNGNVEANFGYLPRTSLNTNLSWKLDQWSWFVNGGGNYRENKMTNNNFSRFLTNGIFSSIIDQKGITNSQNDNYNTNFGFSYDASSSLIINSSFVINTTQSVSEGVNSYKNYNASQILVKDYQRIAVGMNDTNTFQWDAGLEKKFNTKGHLLTASTSIQSSKNNSSSDITDNIQSPALKQNLINNNDETTFLAKTDYELPLGEKSKFEAGARFDQRKNNTFNQFSDIVNGVGNIDPEVSNLIQYDERITAAYAQFKSKLNKLNYQLGLRNEYTQIGIDYKGINNSVVNKNYNALFPSVFLSYELTQKSQLQLNYSRRLNRPRSFFLIPSIRVQDNVNRFEGNADLNPVYIHSFELGYNLAQAKFSINPTIYVQLSKDNFNMFPTVSVDTNGQNIITTRVYNIGNETRYGLDTNSSITLYSWWRLFGNVNLFGYKNQGSFRAIDFENSGYATEAKLSNSFKLNKTTNLQLQSNYESGVKSLNNNRLAVYSFSLGFNTSIWNNQGSIGLNVQDIFNSRKRRIEQNYANLQKEMMMQFQPRMLSLTLTYKFKNKDFGDEKTKTKDKNKEIPIRGNDEAM